jgi:hypothetical protein
VHRDRREGGLAHRLRREERFLREAEARVGVGHVITTVDVFVLAIKAGLLTVEEADADKLRSFKRLLPDSVTEVTILADRGFGDIDLYDMLRAELWLRLHHPLPQVHPLPRRVGGGAARRGLGPEQRPALLLPHARVTGAKLLHVP